MLRINKREPFITEVEKAEYEKLMRESRKINSQFYSNQQAHIENKFISEFEERERKKKISDDINLRTEIIKKSWEDQKLANELMDKERQRKKRLQRYVIDKMSRKVTRKRILDALDAEAKSWVSTPNNSKNPVAPDIFGSQSDYLLRLQERAMLTLKGNYDELDEYTLENEVLDFKNSIIIPLYGKLRNIIKLLLDSPFGKLRREWKLAERAMKLSDQNQLEELKTSYSRLMQLLKQKYSNIKKRFDLMEKKLKLIYLLLGTWKRYTFILLMSHEEVKAAMNFTNFLEEKDADPEKTEEEYKKRLSQFFQGQGESLTDMEQFVSGFKDLEDLAHQDSSFDSDKSEFHKILSEYLSPTDIENFEVEFDQLKNKYDSVYGEPNFQDFSNQQSYITPDQANQIFKDFKEVNDSGDLLDIEPDINEPHSSEHLEGSFFGKLLCEKVESFKGVVNENRFSKAKQIAQRIAQFCVEEPQLLQKIFEQEEKMYY